MRLKSVKLTHFRGYRSTTVIPIDEAMTGIFGRVFFCQFFHKFNKRKDGSL